MRTLDKCLVAFCNIIHRESAQAFDAEIFTDERADDIAMDNRPLDFIDGIAAIRLGFHQRKIAEKASGKSIACTGWVDDLF